MIGMASGPRLLFTNRDSRNWKPTRKGISTQNNNSDFRISTSEFFVFPLPHSDFPLQTRFPDRLSAPHHWPSGLSGIGEGYPAGLHDIAPVGDFESQVGILLHQKNGGFALGVYFSDNIKYLFDNNRCQTQGRFIQQQQARAVWPSRPGIWQASAARRR